MYLPVVIIQVLLPRERLAASRTTVRFVGRMAFHVTLQRGVVREYVETNGTREHAAAQVAFPMPSEFLGVGECFPADLTSKRFPFGVVTSVNDQLIAKLKEFPANITAMGADHHRCRVIITGNVGVIRWIVFVFSHHSDAGWILLWYAHIVGTGLYDSLLIRT